MFDLKEPKRLGDGCDCPHCEWLRKTCDRIEALEREENALRGCYEAAKFRRDELERENAALRKVVEAARLCVTPCEHGGAECSCMSNRETYLEACLAALAPAMSAKVSPCPDCGAVDWREDEHSYGCRQCDKVLGKSGSGPATSKEPT